MKKQIHFADTSRSRVILLSEEKGLNAIENKYHSLRIISFTVNVALLDTKHFGTKSRCLLLYHNLCKNLTRAEEMLHKSAIFQAKSGGEGRRVEEGRLNSKDYIKMFPA